MLFQQVNRTDAEKVFGVYTAVGALAADMPVCLDISATGNVTGYHISSATAAALDCVVGVTDAAFTASAVGLVQLYGYRATSLVLITDTSYAAGVKLVPVDQKSYLQYVTTADGRDGHFAALVSISTSSASKTGSAKIFIRCL